MIVVLGIPRWARGVFYGWWMAGLAAFVMVIGTVPLFSALPAWFVVLERNFGWSRSELALAFSLTRVEGSIMGPVAGYLIDKLGPRRMVPFGMLVMGGGFLLFSRMQNLWQFYLTFMVMSMGAGLGTWLPMMTVVNNWFLRRRATAMAIAIEGFAIGGVVLVPALAWAIDPDMFGLERWRAVAAGIGVALILLAFPISRLVRNRPEDYGLLPDGDLPAAAPVDTMESPAPAPQVGGYTWQQALRTRGFWLITIGGSCTSVVIVTITVHLGPMLDDRGFSLQTVGWVVATYTGVGALFILVGGLVGDRAPMRITLFGFSALQSVSVIILLLADTLAVVYLFAVVMGVGFGGRIPLSAAIRGMYFGRKSFASIVGVSMIPENVLLLAFPVFAGIMFDQTGSYQVPLVAVAVVSFIGATLFLFLDKLEPSATGRSSASPLV